MRIGLHHQALGLDADLVATELSPGDEELLLGGEAVKVRGTGLAFERFLVRKKCNLRAPQVADAFAQHELAVVVDSGLDEVVVELIGNTSAALLKLLLVCVCPPVAE